MRPGTIAYSEQQYWFFWRCFILGFSSSIQFLLHHIFRSWAISYIARTLLNNISKIYAILRTNIFPPQSRLLIRAWWVTPGMKMHTCRLFTDQYYIWKGIPFIPWFQYQPPFLLSYTYPKSTWILRSIQASRNLQSFNHLLLGPTPIYEVGAL